MRPTGMAGKQIIIVGAAPRYEIVPHILNAEIWTIPSALPIRRVTRIIEIHDYMVARTQQRINEANPEVVYMLEPSPLIKNSVRFPIEIFVERFGEQFNNCISYLIAMAIIEYQQGAQPMILYLRRLHTVASEEYKKQIPQICYYVGYARGIGIDVRVSEHSILLKPKSLYMYKDYEYGGS